MQETKHGIRSRSSEESEPALWGDGVFKQHQPAVTTQVFLKLHWGAPSLFKSIKGSSPVSGSAQAFLKTLPLEAYMQYFMLSFKDYILRLHEQTVHQMTDITTTPKKNPISMHKLEHCYILC